LEKAVKEINQLAAGSTPKKSWTIDELSKAGKKLDPSDKGGQLTKAGRGLQKHRSGPTGRKNSGKFPEAKGSPMEINILGQSQLDDILTNPGTTIKNLGRGGVECRAPDGRGVRFNADGSFSGFLD